MLRKQVHAGERFHHLVTVDVHSRGRGAVWNCTCDCGRSVLATSTRLNAGTKQSCGCRKRERSKGKENGKWRGYQDISLSYWSNLLTGAKNRKLHVSLTIEQAWEIYVSQNGLCALSGVPIQFGGRNIGTASLDRKDSNLGYSPKNVQWVHKTVNRLKTNMSDSEFIRWCSLISKHNGNPR